MCVSRTPVYDQFEFVYICSFPHFPHRLNHPFHSVPLSVNGLPSKIVSNCLEWDEHVSRFAVQKKEKKQTSPRRYRRWTCTWLQTTTTCIFILLDLVRLNGLFNELIRCDCHGNVKEYRDPPDTIDSNNSISV